MAKEKNIDNKNEYILDENDITVIDPGVAKKAVVATALGNAME